MNKAYKVLLLTVSAVLCSEVTLASTSENLAARQAESSSQNRIFIAEQLDNPYSIENMQKAFDHYNAKTSDSAFAKRAPVSATHKYVRITPTTELHLSAIEKLDGSLDGEIVLHDFPLNREITSEGDFYVNPANETDLYHPVYAVVPVDYVMPKGLPFEVLDKVYQPTDAEEEVETLSLELAGWSNEEGCRDSEVVCSEKEMVPEEPSIGPQVLPETGETAARLFGRRYRPHGHVMIQNTDTGTFEPLRQAKISIGRGIWWRYTHTDNNGYFVAPKKYRGKVRIRAKWRSNIATIRKSWNEMLGIQVSDHLMTITRSSNGRTKNIYFGDDRLWYKGTVHNGLVKYNDFAAANGINQLVNNANVWVWKNGSGSASTPMLYKHRNLAAMASIAGIGQSNFWDVLVNGISSFLINLVPSHLRPDMLFTGLKDYHRTGPQVSTKEIEQVVFHESAHYSHSVQAGSWYWAKLAASEIANTIIHGEPYVDGSQPSYTAAKQIAMVEGWANFVEVKAMLNQNNEFRYESYWYGIEDTNEMMNNFSMYTVPMTLQRDDLNSWFTHGLFWDITDNSTEEYSRYRVGTTGALVSNSFAGRIKDNLYIYNTNSLHPIFSLLKSDVYTACDFGEDLVAANVAKGPQIEELFHSYGYTCIDGGNGLQAPNTPTSFYSSHNGYGSNTLHWSSSANATYYQLYKSSTSSSTSSYYVYSTESASTTAKNIYVSSNYYFKVRACNSAGCSPYSYPRLAYYSEVNRCDDEMNREEEIDRTLREPVEMCAI